MATLTDEDYRTIKEIARADDTAWTTFKTWGLSTPVFKSALQAAETWFVNGFSTAPSTSFKSAIEVETGTCSNAQAKQIGWVWMGWRNRINP